MPFLRSLLQSLVVATAIAGSGLAGFSQAATLKEGSVTVAGEKRAFSAYLPDNFQAGQRYPALIVLHGGGGDNARAAEQTGFARHVDTDQFIAVFPDAGGRQWNDGRETTSSGADDVSFLQAVGRAIASDLGGDPAHIFVAGISNGGMMAQRLACAASDTFAGFAVVSANMPAGLVGNCRPAQPRPFAFFFGSKDPIMPPGGGEVRAGRRAGMGAGGKVISAADTVAFWKDQNGCRRSSEQAVPDSAEDGTTVRQETFQGCKGGTQVVEFDIVGGGHTWPGSAPPERALVRRLVGNTSQDIDATATIVAFFRAYGL